MNKLTLESLQNWVNEVSPVTVNVLKNNFTSMPTVGFGMPGTTFTILKNENYHTTLSIYHLKSQVKVCFENLDKITNERIKEVKLFEYT